MTCCAIYLIFLGALPGFMSAPTTQEIRFPNTTRSVTSRNSEDFVFPEDTEGSFPAQYSLQLENRQGCPNGALFCENVQDYPSDLISNLLESSEISKYRVLFGTDVLSGTHKLYNRVDTTNEEDPCKSSVQIVFPQKAVNKDGVSQFIVNQVKLQDKNILQGIRIETCINKQEYNCDFPIDFLPFGYRAVCKQKHIYRTLLALKETTFKRLELDRFLFPSCCVCVLKHVGHGDSYQLLFQTAI